jgi:hypothetical protein
MPSIFRSTVALLFAVAASNRPASALLAGKELADTRAVTTTSLRGATSSPIVPASRRQLQGWTCFDFDAEQVPCSDFDYCQPLPEPYLCADSLLIAVRTGEIACHWVDAAGFAWILHPQNASCLFQMGCC